VPLLPIRAAAGGAKAWLNRGDLSHLVKAVVMWLKFKKKLKFIVDKMIP